MKIKELIEQLSKFDPEIEAVIKFNDSRQGKVVEIEEQICWREFPTEEDKKHEDYVGEKYFHYFTSDYIMPDNVKDEDIEKSVVIYSNRCDYYPFDNDE